MPQAALEESALEVLRDPLRSLPAFGQVFDQKTSRFVPYDPTRLAPGVQGAILTYLSDPPRTKEGQTRFLTLLASRQSGKSFTSVAGCYPKAAYSPGWDHVTIADTDDRAEYLHRRVTSLHEYWPEPVRSPTVGGRETRQTTFEPLRGGRMRILSAQVKAAGVGQSPDSFIASEGAFWPDFAGSMALINPSLINRDNALVIFECTPWSADCDWAEHCAEAKRQLGRHLYAFYPYWDSMLNRRIWEPDWTLELEEIRMLERWGGPDPESPGPSDYLTKENLAFRRLAFVQDVEIRRNPELFKVLYPSDDIECWLASIKSTFPTAAVEKQQRRKLRAWAGPYMEYMPVSRDAVYVIGVDPVGQAARDHAAIQVLEVCSDGWQQVACYAAHTEPVAFTRELIRVGHRFNDALIGVESVGVGQAVLALLREYDYPNVYYDGKNRPGIATSATGAHSLTKLTAWLADALLDELLLEDADTVAQILTYKHDKLVEEGVRTEILRGGASPRRRDRHHWDKVSALMFAVVLARDASPGRRLPRAGTFEVGRDMIHSGVYRAEEQARKWREMQAKRRVSQRNPWSTPPVRVVR